MPTSFLEQIVTGGQTGADRAALDWAIGRGIAHGGWCPAGRLAEDGPIPARYQLREASSSSYRQRTRLNVRDSDATLIVSLAETLSGGSLSTWRRAEQLGKPCLHVWPALDWRAALPAWLRQRPIRVLNVAGPRARQAPGIAEFVTTVLDELACCLTRPNDRHDEKSPGGDESHPAQRSDGA